MLFLKIVYALCATTCGIAMLVNAFLIHISIMLICLFGLGFFISCFFLVQNVESLQKKVQFLEKELKNVKSDKDNNT